MFSGNYYLPDVPQDAKPDELIVDLRERSLVKTALGELGVAVFEDGEIGEFDLAKLKLGYGLSLDPDLTFTMDIDAVLFELRRRFAARCGGWVPMLGKNRMVSNQFGAYPQPQSMSSDFDPVPVERPMETAAHPDAGRGVKVGILDTKLYRHPDLEGRYEAPERATVFETPDPDEATPWKNGHAAFVAGLILAQAPAAGLVVRDVIDSTGRATGWDTVVELAKFLDDGIDILNLAIGTRASDGICPMVVQRAIERLSPHMLVVAAAGNHGEVPGISNSITRMSATWPAALTGVVAVGATTTEGKPAPFSPDLPWVACTALGDKVTSTYLFGKVLLHSGQEEEFHGYASWRGTSFATATVSGAIAARTKPGEVTPAGAFDDVLAAGDAVKKFAWEDKELFS